MRMFIKDIHRSLRTLAKRPAFFVVAPLTPSLGIGANTTLFSVVHAVVWRQLPFRHTDGTFWTKRIVQVYYRFIRKRRPRERPIVITVISKGVNRTLRLMLLDR